MNNLEEPRVYIALPVINENKRLPALITSIFDQSWPFIELYICVNQPEEWWELPDKRPVCEANALTLQFLGELKDPRIKIIDHSSKGIGWKGKKHGVGWARKILMDAILEEAADTDILVSLDADTTFGRDYLRSVVENFCDHPDAVGMAVPYFHQPVADEEAYRAILRYEIYMRHYSLNLWRIGSPYAFTALGSAMACPVRSYRAIGGMTPKMSGEDFYFLQKLRKYGEILCWNREKVYPAARFSDRVYFGTGPAMIKGNQGDWNSYPIYPYWFFDEIKETYDRFGSFFQKTTQTPLTDFAKEIFCEEDPFQPLRMNSRTEERFIRACHEKLDGLRLLQYVKKRNAAHPQQDEKNLVDFLEKFYGKENLKQLIPDTAEFSFITSSLGLQENIRLFLVKKEEEYQVNSLL